MLAELREHLEAKGVAPDVLDDFQVAENEVEVDALTEALDELSKAMKKDDEKKDDKQVNLFDKAEDMDDEDMGEDEDLEDLERGYYRDAMKALASGTDEVIAQMEKRMGAVMKGLEAVLGEMKKMKMSSDEMNKSLTASLNQTTAPRAVTSAPVAPSAPAVSEPTRTDVIRKGLKLLQSDLDITRKSAIRGAIARLEAGVPVSSVTHLIDLD